jgi:hypothetical protein
MSKESTKGDAYDENYPPVFSGHIHAPCVIQPNITYIGSARQIASDESPDKRVCLMTFDEDGPQLDSIDLGLKGRKEIEMEYADVKNFDFAMLETYYIKLHVRGTAEQFKLFRKSELHAKLVREGVKIGFVFVTDERAINIDLSVLADDASFEKIFLELVKTKPELIQDAYGEVFGVSIKELPQKDECDSDEECPYIIVTETEDSIEWREGDYVD